MKTFIYSISILLLAISCKNDLPFDIKNTSSKLVINALFDTEKEENEITLALTGRDQATIIRDGTIDIYINGKLKDQITGTDPETESLLYNSVVYKTKVSFKSGDLVKIVAETQDGLYSAWSEAVVPTPVPIEKIDTTMVFYNMWNSLRKYFRVKTTFTDNGQSTNYYRITNGFDVQIEGTSVLTGNDTICCYSTGGNNFLINEDIVLTDGRPSSNDDQSEVLAPVRNAWGIFDNSRINGTYTMTTSVPVPFVITWLDSGYDIYYNVKIKKIKIRLRIKLFSISEIQYSYLKALNLYESIDTDDILNLPIKFPSNIEGGTGIFGISSGDEVVIPLEDIVYDD